MVLQSRNIINESERNRIRSLYGLKTEKEYVFDFVLTENNKYVILMDQVFVEGGNGKSIGSIWENTHIFNELIKESFSKLKNINENVRENIDVILESIVWKKEDVKKWIDGSKNSVISEGLVDDAWNWTKSAASDAWNWTKSAASDAWNWTKSQVANAAAWVFKQGVLPGLRWIRRNAQTNIGIVIDVVVAILSWKSSAVVWGIICLLDIYEIATGDYDPKDPERSQMPFFYLLLDLITCFLTVGVAVAFKSVAKPLIKTGKPITDSKIINIVKSLVSKIPGAKTFLKKIVDALTKQFPNNNVISTMGRGLNNIFVKIEEFLRKLVPAAFAGVATLGVVKATQYGLEKSGAQEKLGKYAVAIDQNLKGQATKLTGNEDIGALKVDSESSAAIMDRYNRINNQQ